MTVEDLRPWVSLFWTALGPTVIIPCLAALALKGHAWLDSRVRGQEVANTAADQAKMETELQAALGKGFDAASAAIGVGGLTSDTARQAILAGATAYFQQRFPDRAAQLDAATPSHISPEQAITDTLAARLGNILAATVQTRPPTQGTPS